VIITTECGRVLAVVKVTLQLVLVIVTLVMTAHTMSFRYEFACKGFSSVWKGTSPCDVAK